MVNNVGEGSEDVLGQLKQYIRESEATELQQATMLAMLLAIMEE